MKWYAHYCEYGCGAVDDCGKYLGDYYAFPSKRSRDAWVEKHEWDCNSNWITRKATHAEVVSQLGIRFVVSDREEDDFDGAQLCKKY